MRVERSREYLSAEITILAQYVPFKYHRLQSVDKGRRGGDRSAWRLNIGAVIHERNNGWRRAAKANHPEGLHGASQWPAPLIFRRLGQARVIFT